MTTLSALAHLLTVSALTCVLPAQWTGEWKLDETSGLQASDVSPKKNHGTLNNFSTTSSPWVKGKSGNALAFDGVDDYVEINGSSPVFDGLGSPFSIAYWLKAKTQSDKRVYSEGNQNSSTGAGALFTIGSSNVPSSDKARFWCRNDKHSTAGYFTLDSKTTVYDDTWHHVAFVHVSGQVTVYVDGKVDNSGTYSAGATGFGTYTTNRVGIGAVLRRSACCLFIGLLDDVRVYNYALSALDVTLIHLGTALLPCSASVGKYGHSCGGTLAITATGTAQFGKVLGLKLSGGTPNAAALVLAGTPVKPLDLSFAFPGCFAYPDLATALLVGIGKLDSTGSSATLNLTIPNSPGCVIGVVQGVTMSGAKLELSPAILAQLGK